MDPGFGLQLLGYAASVLIATSLLMRSIVRLRVINMIGAATFSVYGFLIGAPPVGALNLLTTMINVVQLIRLRRRREIFRTIEIGSDAPYLQYFLEVQSNDIRRFFPSFRFAARGRDEERLVLLVLRDLVPAGVVIGAIRGTRLEIELDYVMPQFRDLKVGRFLFSDEVEFFRRRGIREIISPSETPEHRRYLEEIGFEKRDEETYRLEID